MTIISISDAVANESDDLIFTVTLSQASFGDVTVDYRTVQDGSAIEGYDYNEGSGTLTIPAGSLSGTITVSSRYNNVDENDKNFTLELSDPVNATLETNEPVLTATGIVLDVDGTSVDRALFVSDPIILEGDSGTKQAVFEIELSEALGTNLTLNYTTADGSAIAGEDYTAKSGSLTFIAGQTFATVAVDITGDTEIEENEAFSLVFEPNAAIASGAADNAGVATILADDASQSLPVISLLNTESNEFYGDGKFLIVLSEPYPADVTVEYRTIQDGSATEGYDYTYASGTVTIPAGQTAIWLEPANRYNNVDEDDKNFTLELSDPVNAVLAGEGPVLSATAIISDADGTSADRALFVSDPIFLEGDQGGKQAIFEIQLSEPLTNNLTLNFSTADGTAVAGEDYQSRTGSIVFLAGQTVASVAVNIIGDSISETDETFSLVFEPNAAIASGVADNGGVATILDDDTTSSLPVISIVDAESSEFYGDSRFLIVLSESYPSDVTVQYRTVMDGDATEGYDYTASTGTITFPAGETSKLLTISNRYNNLDEDDKAFTLELSDPVNGVLAGGGHVLTASGVIYDSDGTSADRGISVSSPLLLEGDDGSTQAVFEIKLSEPLTSDLTLDFSTADGTAVSGEDYVAKTGTITFLAGQTVASVAVDVLGDTKVETQETFSLVVEANPAIANGVANNAGIATILSDDGDSIFPTLSILNTKSSEFYGDGQFLIVLSEAYSSDVSFDYRTLPDGSAIEGTDYTAASSTVVIPAGQTSVWLQVTNRYNNTDENDENHTLEISNPVNAVLAGGESVLTATGTIFDSDGSTADRAIFVSDPTLVEGEYGQREMIFEVQLSEAFTSDISLTYSTADGTATAGEDYVAQSGSLTFLAGQTIGSVTVQINGDCDLELSESFSLIFAPNAIFAETVDGTGTGTILNDDVAGLTILGTNIVDELVGQEGCDTIFGYNRSDLIEGFGGGDTLYGGQGNDVVYGDDGRDKVFGGDGTDRLFGGDGDDDISGNAGDDSLKGNNDNDILRGAGGDDEMFGGSGDDTLFGGNNRDYLSGGANNDTLEGAAAKDELYGGSGSDTLKGGSGDDTLDGGNGADVLNGGKGRDVFTGGLGNDTMTGGGQNDTFIFKDNFGTDIIKDFNANADGEKIDLSAVSEISNFNDLDQNHMNQVGNDVVITDGSNSISLEDVDLAKLDIDDFLF